MADTKVSARPKPVPPPPPRVEEKKPDASKIDASKVDASKVEAKNVEAKNLEAKVEAKNVEAKNVEASPVDELEVTSPRGRRAPDNSVEKRSLPEGQRPAREGEVKAAELQKRDPLPRGRSAEGSGETTDPRRPRAIPPGSNTGGMFANIANTLNTLSGAGDARTTSGEGRTDGRTTSGEGARTPPQPPPPIVSSLSPSQRTTFENTYAGNNGSRVRDSVNGLVQSPAFNALDADTQRRTLNIIAQPTRRSGIGNTTLTEAAPPSAQELTRTTEEARRLVESRAMRDATPPQRRQIIETYEAADTRARTTLVNLASPANNAASPLLARDARGGTMIDSLHALSTRPLQRELEPQRRALVSGTIEEIADPARTINQDNRGTCAATTVQYHLARTRPAEYARIVAGLASPEGNVALANGETMSRVVDAAARDDSNRSPSERLVQSAFMDFGNGALTYRNNVNANGGPATEVSGARDSSFFADGNRAGGLALGETRRLMSAVMGEPYQTNSTRSLTRLERDASAVRRFFTTLYDALPSMRFGPDPRDPWNTVQARNGQPTSVAMRWGDGAHQVTVENIREGRVYFRNPWGAQPGIDAGTNLESPPRRMEDPQRGIASMSIADFRRHLYAAVVPS